MKNNQIIEKILKSIDYKSYKLSKPVYIDNEPFVEIIYYKNEFYESAYIWSLANNDWEIGLKDLTNRELIKLYQSL